MLLAGDHQAHLASRAGESHPHALPEPYVTLSRHTAPDVRPFPCRKRRRGKRHAARQGAVSVLSGAPYGYRYVGKRDGGVARYEILEDEAWIVRRIFAWIGRERVSPRGTRRRP